MLPIIFIHSRNHNYLPLSLLKAKESNPGSDVILLGDGQNAHLGSIVHHFHHLKYAKQATELAKVFVNFSTNPSDFELICLQRWMILLDFLDENKIDQCLYLDSDVLLFDEMVSDAQRFQTYGMTVAGISGHTNFIHGRNTLERFCKHIQNAYTQPEARLILEDKYKVFRQYHEAGGISDMTFFTEFRAENPVSILDISEPIEGRMFDITITYTHGVKAENGIKKLTWEENRPYAESLTGDEIEMRSLHFQGDSKRYMKQMAGNLSVTGESLYQLNTQYVLGQKVWNKLIRQ